MSVMLSQMIVEYELRDPFLPEGEYDGWCQDWLQGSLSGDSFWIDLEKEECWQHCREDSSCYQAVYEVGRDSGTQCWIGTNKMTDPPTGWDRPNATNTCYAKAVGIEPVFIREEKFISSSDVVTTSILSDRLVTLHMSLDCLGYPASTAGPSRKTVGALMANVQMAPRYDSTLLRGAMP